MISTIGRLPTHGNRSFSKRRMMRSPWLATQFGENFACHSRAMASKLSAPPWASLPALRASPGSIPEASVWPGAGL